MISGGSPRPTTYLFIDAGHLKQNFARVTEAWCGVPTAFDVAKVRNAFNAAKVFYYDSIDDAQRAGETLDQLARRVEQQEKLFRQINALSDTHVRLGSVTGSGKKRRQKEVDILIAVDMMNHAIRQNMHRAVLLTGDRDFTPLVETLVQLGLTVEVAGDARFTSDILAASADRYTALTLRYYFSWMTNDSQRAAVPLLSFTSGDINRGSAVPLVAGAVGDGDWQGELYPNSVGGVVFVMKRPDVAMYINTARDAIARLKLYVSLEYGDVPWLPDSI